MAGITDWSMTTARPASASAISTTGRRTAWTSLSRTGSRNAPSLVPVWLAMKSTHTWSLALSRPRPARKAANRSSTTWWRRIVPSDLPASRNAARTRPAAP